MAKTYTYTVMRDYWDETATRVSKGTEVELTADEAQDQVESGALARVKAKK